MITVQVIFNFRVSRGSVSAGLPAIVPVSAATATPAPVRPALAATTLTSRLLGPSFVHFEAASTELGFIQGIYGSPGFTIVRHLNEGEPSRFTRILILDDRN
jgi:hypothetical protein